jgi:hypothetical protein
MWSWYSLGESRKCLPFMKSDDSLLHSPECTTEKSVLSQMNAFHVHTILFLYDTVSYYPPIYIYVYQVASSFNILRLLWICKGYVSSI